MTPLKRTIINGVLFLAVYVIVTYIMEHYIDFKILAVLSIVYLVLNYIIYAVLDKVSKDE